MSPRKKLLFIFCLFFFSACSSNNDEAIPTLVPTLSSSNSIVSNEASTSENFQTVTSESLPLGINFSHPENWEVGALDENAIRLLPVPNSILASESVVGPAILIERLSTDDFVFPDAVDEGEPTAVLAYLVEQLPFEYVMVEEITAVSLNNQNAAQFTYQQQLDSVIPEGPDAPEIQLGRITTHLAVIVVDDQIISFSGTALDSDYESVQPTFQQILETMTLTGNPTNPTEE